MAGITLSAGVRQNLLSLQNTADLMATTQNRLATGKKVNSALDNPTNFFTASSLSSRSNDLSNLLDAMSNGMKTIEAADNGLTAITRTVESMQSTLRQARQDKSFGSESFSIDATAVGTSSSKNITFSGGALDSAVNIAVNSTGSATQSTVASSADYQAPTAATGPVFTAGTYTPLDMTTGDETYTFNIQGPDDGAAISVSLGTADNTGGGTDLTIAETIVGINNDLQNGSSTVRVRENAGKLEFYDTNTANTGTAKSINVDAITTGGTSPTTSTATAGLGWTGNPAAVAGTNAQTRSITISNGTATATLELTAANAGTASAARTYIADQLASQGVLGVTVGGSGNRVDLAGLADGSNDVTVGGTGADSVFGAARTVTGGTEGGKVKTVDELVDAINANSLLDGKVKATNDNGKLRVENLSTQALTIVGSTTSGVVNGGTGSANTSTVDGNDVRKNLVKQFNDLRDQLDKLSGDASFNGINLLRGDKLKITFNEDGSSTIDVQAKDSAGNVRGISTGDDSLDINEAEEEDFDSDTSIDSLLEGLSTALGTLRSQSSAFGSNLSMVENRQQFTKSMINTLQTGADALTLADSNEEAANMLALQTRQQLSSTALSLASQADQAVLSLF